MATQEPIPEQRKEIMMKVFGTTLVGWVEESANKIMELSWQKSREECIKILRDKADSHFFDCDGDDCIGLKVKSLYKLLQSSQQPKKEKI